MDYRQPTLFEEPPIQEAPETGKTTSDLSIPEAFKITNETVLEPAAPEIAKSTVERILEHINNRLPNPLSVVKPALIENPTDPEVLILAALAALLEERPDQSLTYQKRLKRRYVPSPAVHLLHALALAQKRLWPQAARIMDQHFFNDFGISRWPYYLPCGDVLRPWVRRWLKTIETENDRLLAPREKAPRKPSPRTPDIAKRSKTSATPEPLAQKTAQHEEAVAPTLPALPRLSAQIPVSFDLPGADSFVLTTEVPNEDPTWFACVRSLPISACCRDSTSFSVCRCCMT